MHGIEYLFNLTYDQNGRLLYIGSMLRAETKFFLTLMNIGFYYA